jgi:putative ABC transport system permease protein
VFIGCLGLFGLASYAVAKRAREIGIYKVLGASGSDIVRLMIKEYVLLTAAANLIAWPIAYMIMMNWLKGFAYRTTIGWTIFAIAGTLTLFITLIAVGGHTARAAATDPAIVLRSE